MLDRLLDVAALELSVRRLADEIARTTRRMNALEHVVLPGLETERAHIALVLEEREMEDRVRLRRVRSTRSRRRRAAMSAPNETLRATRWTPSGGSRARSRNATPRATRPGSALDAARAEAERLLADARAAPGRRRAAVAALRCSPKPRPRRRRSVPPATPRRASCLSAWPRRATSWSPSSPQLLLPREA